MVRSICILALMLCPTLAFAQVGSTGSVATAGSSAATATAASSLTVAGQHSLLGATVVANCPSGCTMMIFDATSPPANGAVSPGYCWPLPPTTSPNILSAGSMANTPNAVNTRTGITVVISSGADCFTLVKQTGFIVMNYQ